MVQHGVDMFVSAYPHQLTQKGRAMVFALDNEQSAENKVCGSAVLCRTAHHCIDNRILLRCCVSPISHTVLSIKMCALHAILPFFFSYSPTMQPPVICLHDKTFRTDPSPLLPGCQCFACLKHTRAYIHHLLNVHEMLAEILLEM